jgi:uncharacterized protein
MLQPVITKALIAALRREFALDWHGIHGAGHWARVRHNGLQLAPATGAATHVVELFAFLHDVKRQDDGTDRHHGMRAAEFARSLHGTHFHLDDRDMDSLVVACAGHTFETASSDPTVLTCWDADRLDLGRVGIVPDPSRLCTDAARDPDVITAAFARSRVQTSLRYTTLRGVSCES